MSSNAIVVGKRAGLTIAQAIASVVRNPESIPYRNEELSAFVPTINDKSVKTVSESVLAEHQETVAQIIQANTNASSKSAKPLDVMNCLRREHLYGGLPDECFELKKEHFLSCLEFVGISEREDGLTALPFFLKDQASLICRTEI